MNKMSNYSRTRKPHHQRPKNSKGFTEHRKGEVFEVLGTNRVREPLISKWELAAIVGFGLGSVILIGIFAWISTR